MEVSGQLYAPAALPQRKRPFHSLDRSLVGPQSRFGRGGEQKNSQPLPGLEVIQPVAQRCTAELSRLLRNVLFYEEINTTKYCGSEAGS